MHSESCKFQKLPKVTPLIWHRCGLSSPESWPSETSRRPADIIGIAKDNMLGKDKKEDGYGNMTPQTETDRQTDRPRKGPLRRTSADRGGVGLRAGGFAPKPPASKQRARIIRAHIQICKHMMQIRMYTRTHLQCTVYIYMHTRIAYIYIYIYIYIHR